MLARTSQLPQIYVLPFLTIAALLYCCERGNAFLPTYQLMRNAASMGSRRMKMQITSFPEDRLKPDAFPLNALSESEIEPRAQVQMAATFLQPPGGGGSQLSTDGSTRTNKVDGNPASTSQNNLPPSQTNVVLNPTLGNRRLAAGLAFLTGWADVAMNARVATFCTMMTGNSLWFCRALVQRKPMVVMYYTSVIASYLVGLAAFRHQHKYYTRSRASTSTDQEPPPKGRESILKLTTLVVVPLFVIADLLLKRNTFAAAPGIPASNLSVQARWIPALFLSFGYAWVNSVGSDVADNVTSVVTGHMTKMVNHVVDLMVKDNLSFLGAFAKLMKQKPAFVTNLTMLVSLTAGGGWASIIIANPHWWVHRKNTLGDFSWIGIICGALFLWKDRVIRTNPSHVPLWKKVWNHVNGNQSGPSPSTKQPLAAETRETLDQALSLDTSISIATNGVDDSTSVKDMQSVTLVHNPSSFDPTPISSATLL